MPLALPYTFTDDTTAYAGQVNANFSALETAFNGLSPVDVSEFGVLYDGSDQTAHLNAALGSGAKWLLISGVVGVTNLAAPPANVRISGATQYFSTIKTLSNNGDVLPLTNPGVIVDHLGFASSVTRAAGAFIRCQATNLTITDFLMSDGWGAIWLDDTASGSAINNGYIFDSVGGGQSVLKYGSGTGSLDANYLGHTIINSGTPNYVTLEIVNCGDITIEYLQALSATTNLLVDPGNGQTVDSLCVSNSWFDHGGTMAAFLPSGTGVISRGKFITTWFGSGTANNIKCDGGTGSALIDGLSFMNCESLDCSAGFGLDVSNRTKNIAWLGGRIGGNDIGIFDSRSAGFDGLIVQGALIGAGGGILGNTYGMSAGNAGDYLSLIGNDMRGNTTAAYASTNTGTHNKTIDNSGLNPVGNFVPTVGASPWPYTASSNRETMFISGSLSGLSVTINGINVGSQTAFSLEPNDQLIISYTGTAPTVNVRRC